MNNVYPGEERRKFKRVRISLLVVFRKDEPLDVRIRKGEVEHKATMLDISEGGMSVMTDVNIPVATVILIKFTLTRAEKVSVDYYGTMELKGEVRYNILLEEGLYRLGICFLDIKERDKCEIANFVDMVEKQFKGSQ